MPNSVEVRPGRLLLRVEEVADALAISPRTVYALIEAGDLATVKVGRLRRIRVSEVRDYADRLQVAGA